jgi:KDO2-lipid IV(A) lauroyltransferase
MTERPTFRHYLEAGPLWLIPKLLRVLPFKARVRFGGAFIAALVRWTPGLRKRVLSNLDLIYPSQPEAEKKALAAKIARNIGWGYIEMLFSLSLQSRLAHFHLQSDITPLLQAHAQGKPIILVSAHFGSWDAIRALLADQNAPVGALFKLPNNPILARRYVANVGGGQPMFEATPRGMADMLRYLKTGGIVSILTDQRPLEGEWLDFMGQPALTALSAAKLALKTDALLVPCYGVRRASIDDIDVYIEPPIPHGDPVDMTRSINDSLTKRVTEHPEQWYWLHQRWKKTSAQPIVK